MYDIVTEPIVPFKGMAVGRTGGRKNYDLVLRHFVVK